ncbi:hypothetical protein D3C72_961070 [compost metagenome]
MVISPIVWQANPTAMHRPIKAPAFTSASVRPFRIGQETAIRRRAAKVNRTPRKANGPPDCSPICVIKKVSPQITVIATSTTSGNQ